MLLLPFFLLVVAASSLKVSRLSVKPKQSLDQPAVVRVPEASLYDPANFAVNSIIVCDDCNRVIMHSSKLDTASRVGGTLFSSAENTKQSKTRWYEFDGGARATVMGPRIPLTGCLDMTHGDGGLLSGLFSKSVGGTASLDLAYGIDLGLVGSGGITTGFSIGTALSIEAAYSCTIDAGETGQMFLQPFLTEIDGGSYREIVVEKRRLRSTAVRPQAWAGLPAVRVALALARPVVTCATDPQVLMCGSNVLTDPFKLIAN